MAKSTIVEKNVPIEEHPYILPDGWEWRRLGSLIENHDNKRVPISQKERQKRSGEYPYYGASGIIDYIDGYTHDGRFLLISEDGANLLARSKPIAFLASGKIWVNNHAHVVKFETDLLDEFFCYYLNNTDLSRYISGTAQPKLTQKKLVTIPVPYCLDTEKQKDIVSKIKSMLGKINEARELISEARESFQNRRAAILAKAFRGELTAKWREQNRDVESGFQLINFIAEDKKNRKIKSAKSTKDFSHLSDYEHQIPSTWSWSKLSEVNDIITDGDHQSPPKADKGIPFLVISNISKGTLDFSNTRFVPESYYNNLTEYRKPRDKDILYTVVGSYGIPVHLQNIQKTFCFQRHIALIRPNKMISSEYIYYALCTSNIFQQATEVATGTAQLTVPLAGLREIRLPIPSREEQKQIVILLKKYLKSEETALKQFLNIIDLETLEKSILSQAFRGQLTSNLSQGAPTD